MNAVSVSCERAPPLRGPSGVDRFESVVVGWGAMLVFFQLDKVKKQQANWIVDDEVFVSSQFLFFNNDYVGLIRADQGTHPRRSVPDSLCL